MVLLAYQMCAIHCRSTWTTVYIKNKTILECFDHLKWSHHTRATMHHGTFSKDPMVLRALRTTDLKLLMHKTFNIYKSSQQTSHWMWLYLNTWNAKQVYYKYIKIQSNLKTLDETQIIVGLENYCSPQAQCRMGRIIGITFPG